MESRARGVALPPPLRKERTGALARRLEHEREADLDRRWPGRGEAPAQDGRADAPRNLGVPHAILVDVGPAHGAGGRYAPANHDLAGESAREILDSARAASAPPLRTVAPGLPAELSTVVDKAMAPDPADRYPTAFELGEDLKRFHAGQLVGSHRYSPVALVVRWIRRNRAAVLVAAAAAALAAFARC